MKGKRIIYVLLIILAVAVACAGFILLGPDIKVGKRNAENIVTPTLTPTLTNTPTPTNTATPTPLPEKLLISEVMASNKTYPVNGSLGDWIELVNNGDTDIDLSGFYLSDKEEKPFKCRLPEVVLAPGEYIVLTCDNEISITGQEEKATIKGDLDLKLSADGETVLLTRADGLIIDTLTYENLDSDCTATHEGVSDAPTPGFANTAENNLLVKAEIEAGSTGLVINEILSSNNSISKYTASDGISDYYDMVELYNASEEAILLSDYGLSDSAKHLLDYRLPDVTLEPGQYMLIYCMGELATNKDDTTGIFTVPESAIELSYFGETLYLVDKNGYVCDCVTYPEMYNGVSYGRSSENSGEFVLQAKPSLGKANGTGEKTFSAKPVASVESGAYTGDITVEFTSAGTIYYTTDCSAPTKASKVWDGTPLTFSKTTTLRAICYEDDKLKSFETTYNYFINDLDVTLDVVSVSMSGSDYSAIKASGSRDPEYAVNVAFYKNNRDDDTLVLSEEFSLTAEIELAGASSLACEKQSYQIIFKSSYGPSKLKYKLFDDMDIEEFNSFTLRGGSQENARILVRDEFATGLLYSYYGTELILHEAYRPVNLYINNEYRGIYYIREHCDTDMIASHYDVDVSEVALSNDMAVTSYSYKAVYDTYKDELSTARSLAISGDFSDPEVFDEFFSIIDYESALVFWATEFCTVDHDCHIRVYKIGDGKWCFLLHDHDLSWNNMAGDTWATFANKFFASYSTGPLYRAMIQNLLESDQFRSDLLAKTGELMKTAYSNEYMASEAEKLINTLYHDMEYNCDKWGDRILYPKSEGSTTRMFTYSTWKSRSQSFIRLLKGQDEYTIEAIIKYMKLTDEEVALYFGSGDAETISDAGAAENE